MTESVIYGVKPLLRELEALEPGLKKQLVRDAKDIARPIANNIKSHIPRVAPLSGMSQSNNPNGRLAWGAVKPANQIQIRFRSGFSRRSAVTSLLSIWVTSPATALADIAGKGGLSRSVTLSRRYAYKGGTRRHKVNGGNGGRDFVRNLKNVGANDFIYPAVGDSIDDAQVQVKLVVEKYARKVNRRLD